MSNSHAPCADTRYLLNDKVTSEEALRIGLVSKVIHARGDMFRAEVHKIASQVAASAPLGKLGSHAYEYLLCLCRVLASAAMGWVGGW
jgi:enoyl-CoA hydratase/carnithine racemase